MKKLILFFLLFTYSVHAQDKSLKNSSANVLAEMHTAHPRLLMLKGEEDHILEQIKKHKEWSNIHQEILAECDKLIDLPPVERIQIGRRLLDKSRECLRRVFQLSYAYRTTHENKYLKRAEKELLAVSAFTDWNPSHFLDVAEMTMAVAIGYDWLYNELSPESRRVMKEAMIKKGIEPSYDNKSNGFLTVENNWNQVCNAGISFGALAIAEDEPELAAKVIKRSVESMPKSMLHSYQPDGTYPEGFGYWDYGTSFNVLFLSAVEKALKTDFGLSQLPGFLKTAGFMENMVGPSGMAFNWGDSGLKDGLNPALFWFADKLKDQSLLWTQKNLLTAGTKNAVRNRLLPSLLIWGANTDLAGIKTPDRKVWVGQGPNPVGMMRTSWTDPNAIYVGFKAGSPAVNHAHMDVGSFVLDAFGERWAMDFGMQDYNSLESKGVDLWSRTQNSQRWEVFRLNNLAHNTLIFDGQLQNAKGFAKIDSWSESNKNPFVVSDLSDIYPGQAAHVKRGIKIVVGKSVLVRDEVKTTDKAVSIRWNLLTSASVKIVDGKTVELTQNGKKMLLVFDTKAKIEIQTWSTAPTHDYDAPNPNTQFVGFEATLPANTEVSFNVHFTKDKNTIPVKPMSEWTNRE